MADVPCLSPAYIQSTVLLELTDFLFPTDVPQRDVAPSDVRAYANPDGAFPDVPLHSLSKHRPRLNVFCHPALLFPFFLVCVLT